MMMKKKEAVSFSFVHHKGGTGKTTSCINMAGWLQKEGYRVLVVDMDPQGNASTGLGLAKDELEANVFTVLFEESPIQEALYETDSGVVVLPSATGLLSADILLMRKKNKGHVLRRHLDRLRHHFDYILVDLPPASTLVMVNGIVAAPHVVVPMDASIFAYETLVTFHALLESVEEQFGIHPMVEMMLLRDLTSSAADNAKMSGEVRSLTEEFINEQGWMDTKIYQIPFSTQVYESHFKGMPLSHILPATKIAKKFREITLELIQKVSNPTKESP